MTLTEEQIIDLKNQLKSQVANMPEDRKAQALQQIESLSPEALESMLEQQNSGNKNQGEQKSVFRMIVSGDIQSVKIDENKHALAVLDIAPISKAHIVVIPKEIVKNAKELPNQAFTLAKKIAKKIELKLKAKSSEIQSESKFGEVIINLIPIYDSPLNINSPRSKATLEQLEEIAKLLRKKEKPKIEKIKINTKESSPSQILKISRRIP